MFVVYIQSMRKVDVLGRFVDYFFLPNVIRAHRVQLLHVMVTRVRTRRVTGLRTENVVKA